MPLTLYHCPGSPPSRAAVLTAKTLGLDFEIKLIDLLKKDHLKPEFIKINPQHTVPVLDDNGFIIWDSHAIAIYLIESYAKDDSLYPKDVKKRALVNQRLFFDTGSIFPRMRNIVFPIFFLGEKEIEESKKKDFHEALDFLDGFLAPTGYVAGEKMTVADIIMIPAITSMQASGIDMSRHPRVSKWVEKMSKEIPGYEEYNVPGMKAFGEGIRKTLTAGSID